MKKIQSRDLVVKSNQLIEANYRLTAGEQKVLYQLITSISKDDESFKEYEFKISHFLELLEVRNSKKYNEVKNITYSLVGRRLSIYDENLKSLIQASWLAQAQYYENTGIVKLAFAPALKPYLLQLKSRFTQFEVKNVMRLRSGYSMRIYELLAQYKNVGDRVLTVEELRNKLGILNEEYKLYADFKRYVILQAQKEINTKTDIYFDFNEIKGARKKIYAIKFIIKDVYIEQSNTDSISKESLDTVQEVKNEFHRLYKGNLIDKFVMVMLEKKGVQHVKNCIYTYSDYIQGRKISNIAGDFYTFVMNGYEKPVQHKGNIPQYANFEQREYPEEYYEKFFVDFSDYLNTEQNKMRVED